MFTFEDRGGRSMTLRPEGTAPVIRACIENGLLMEGAVTKLYYIMRMYRYERGQRGRYREHQQTGIEAFGSMDPALDAEVIALAMEFYAKLGIRNAELRINSVGCPQCRPAYVEALKSFVTPRLEQMSGENQRRFRENPLRMLDTKDTRDREILRGAPKLIDQPAPRAGDRRHRAVVVGYGPTGRMVTRLLRENGIVPVVVELNMTTIRALRDEGILAVYGDVSQRGTLEQAGVATAANLVLTAAALEQSTEVVRIARELNPRIRILARAMYLRDVSGLEDAGASPVFSGEGEVALAFIEVILQDLGATAEQIDRERDRAHRELLGTARAQNDA
jgi:voltage-gated potassium channel Kch